MLTNMHSEGVDGDPRTLDKLLDGASTRLYHALLYYTILYYALLYYNIMYYYILHTVYYILT